MKLTEFAITIGMAGLAVLTAAITMAVAKMLYSSWTAEGRVQALHDLFRAVSDRHQFLVNELLPKLDQHRYEFSIVENAKRVTDVLLGQRSRNNTLMREVSYSGIYRWSPLYKREETEETMRILMAIDLEIWMCTTKAEELIQQAADEEEKMERLRSESIQSAILESSLLTPPPSSADGEVDSMTSLAGTLEHEAQTEPSPSGLGAGFQPAHTPDISDPTPTTRPGYPLEGLLMERPPPPNLRLDSRILAIRTELFGSTGVPHLSDDRGAPMRSSAPRGGTDVKYNHSLFAGLSHLFDV